MKTLFTTILVLVLVLTSNSAFAQDVSRSDLCRNSVRDRIASRDLAPQDAQADYNACMGISTQVSQRASDTVVVIDAEHDAEIRRMRAQMQLQMERDRLQNDLRAESQRQRNILRQEEQIMRAQTDIEVARIKASAPVECVDDVQMQTRQENINYGSIIASGMRGGLDKAKDSLADEIEDVTRDQKYQRKLKCKNTYLVNQMPQPDHEIGRYTGILKGILNNL